MAGPNFVLGVLILGFLSVSISVEAIDVEECESFGKFTNANDDNDDKENTRVFPNKKEALTTAETLEKQEQQPTFHPQTQHGYGLYRHEEEMIKNTPATATSTSTGDHPSKTTRPDDSFYSYQNGNFENSNRYYNDRSYDRRSNNYHHHNDRSNDRRSNDYHHQREQARDTYMPEEQDFGGNTRLQDSSYTTTTTTTTTKKTSSSASFRGTTVGNNYNTGGIQIERKLKKNKEEKQKSRRGQRNEGQAFWSNSPTWELTKRTVRHVKSNCSFPSLFLFMIIIVIIL
ncbi:hypothetical protein ACJRO7_021345 [Eucalyptus globulus]|uniref:Uncharacterized protein n=1 Tax=Eucalyptus globulus TaxID=34317 RepID=A0ABD3KLC7_EUCGL